MAAANNLRSLFSPAAGLSRKKITVVVEGNIASGKTSFLERFRSDPEVELKPEPVKLWTDVQGCNLLKSFYENQERNAFAFQSYVQLTMLKIHQEAIPVHKDTKLMERSIFSARHCFVENLYRMKKLTREEYTVLTQWFDWVVTLKDIEPDYIVYLRTDPKVVYERLQKRKRPEEVTVSLEYLQKLHELHEDWLIRKPLLGRTGNDSKTRIKWADVIRLMNHTISKSNETAKITRMKSLSLEVIDANVSLEELQESYRDLKRELFARVDGENVEPPAKLRAVASF